MKTKLQIVDYDGRLDARMMARIERAVAKVPLAVADHKRPGCLRADWRDMLRKFVPQVFKQAWVYRGGSHLAIHASAPEKVKPARWSVDAQPSDWSEAGRCLFRIIEVSA